MQRILRINTATREIVDTPVAGDQLLLGGRAMTSGFLLREVPAACHPLGPFNKIIFAVGPLAGTLVSSANRLSVGAKSPLTGGIKESNAGGMLAYKLGRLGLRAVILEGRPAEGDAWQILHIDARGVRLTHAPPELAGVGVYEKSRVLFAKYGARAGLALIGPAGEQRLLCAGVTCTDPEGIPSRYSGRGGLGAVLASKGIMAVVVDDSAAPKEKMADQAAFAAGLRQVAALIAATPQTSEVYRKFGTSAMLSTTNALGALPVRNFSRGTFEKAGSIDGSALYNAIIERGGEGNPSHGCMRGCLIKCSNIFPGKDGKAVVSPLEYESIGLLGSNCGIGDLDAIARLNHACNDMGVDTIDTGAAIAVAMEAGLAPFGDAEFAEKAVKGIISGEILSRVIGSGAEMTGKILGQYRVPTAKGQSMAAYDPRSVKGTGVTYATSAMGADHTAGNTTRLQVKQTEKQGQVGNAKKAQAGIMLLDSLGLCIMLGAAVKDMSLIIGLVNARFGTSFTLAEAETLAARALDDERSFNRKAGLGPPSDRVAEFFYLEKNPDSGGIYDFTPEDFLELTGGR
ncbi:MAG: aldehyde ferredoxin oxidoreductase [Desulfovibrio sp.]|jgi:aldehyde:ferredoxin oxidoreductase|nr:aldehyde ferredoxin oxidoreductase [Desulfovibrio sp.]